MILFKEIKRVSVGSKNPIKVSAIASMLDYYIDHTVSVSGVDAPSNVSDMPLTLLETQQGAYNRAKRCFDNTECDLAFGLEGGINFENTYSGIEQCYLFGVVCIIDHGSMHMTQGGKYLLPLEIAKKLREGENLGPLISNFTGIDRINKKIGTVGYMIGEYIDRQKEFSHTAAQAFIPWIHPHLFTHSNLGK